MLNANVLVLPFVRGTSAAPFHISFLQSLTDLCKFLRLENEHRKKQLGTIPVVPHLVLELEQLCSIILADS